MFQKALQIAQGFTLPVIVSHRRESGALGSNMATHMVINDEGWCLTAYHVVKMMNDLNDEKLTYSATGGRLRNRAARKRKDDGLVTDWASWWGNDNWKLQDLVCDEEADLAVGRLDPFDPRSVPNYVVFKDPEKNFVPGVSLCKLGFPFHEVSFTFDEETRSFKAPPGTLPIPLFPIEGMFVRMPVHVSASGRRIPFIETSTPGLPGQSGGPTFDEEGGVWAMQSRTTHYPLVFANSIQAIQTFNTGVGLHAGVIIECLKNWGIKCRISTK